jgi:hypothetical protein
MMDMRFTPFAPLLLVGALALTPRPATAQISVSLHLGTPLVVTNYAPDAYGDWHTNYRNWRPVTVYSYNGQWYNHSVRGARPVVVYRSQNSYFLPPQDQDWNNKDRRYNYRRRPTSDDYSHAAAPQGRGRGRGRGQNDHPPARP